MAYRKFTSSEDHLSNSSLKPLALSSLDRQSCVTELDVEIKATDTERMGKIADSTTLLVEMTRLNYELAKNNQDKLWTIEKKFDGTVTNVKKTQKITKAISEEEEAKSKSMRCMLMFLLGMLAVFFLVSKASR